MDDSTMAGVTAAGRRPRYRRRAAAVALLVAGVTACSSSGGVVSQSTSVTAPGATAATAASGATAPPSGATPSTGSTAFTPPADAAGVFPAKVSANRRYLVDQHGDPYLMVGDSPQCLSANLSPDDMEFFFADRQSHGFNTAWVNLLCAGYTRGRNDASTYDGIKPFLKEGDLSTPNPAYFARMDTMVALAAKHGITLLLDPAETGSFRDLLKDNGVDKTKAYGMFLGQRYRSAPNIIWMLGNDYQADQWSTYDPFEVALSEGIRQAAPSMLQTIELNVYMSTSYDDGTWPPLIDLASAYTYYPTYDAVLKAYNSKPTQPVFMVEANYEFENNTGGPKTTDETLRRQEYWTMLSGATGQLYGNGYTWGLNDDSWKQHFDTKAVTELGYMVKLFHAAAWQDLVPDQSHQFLVDGSGKYSTSGDVETDDYATAAVTPDRRFAVVYAPSDRTLTIDQSKLAPGAAAQWLDPTDGSSRPASAPFRTPGKNSAGDHDWVLVFKA
jgi:hypothetical protein